MTNRRTIVTASAAAALIAIVVIAAFVWPRRTVVSARVQIVRYADFETTLPEFGTIERPNTQTIAAMQPGSLERFAVRPGQRVRAGTLLATISNPQLVSAAVTAHATYLAAAGRAAGAVEAYAVLPQQNRLSVDQAAAAVDQARLAEDQARSDLAAGAETATGFGGDSASEQRSIADANVAKAETDAREADRIYDANRGLFADKAISHDALDQSQAHAAEMHVALDRALRHRDENNANLVHEAPLLRERLRAAQDALVQAQAALAGDLDAARADAAARYSDWTFALAQAAGLEIRAPFDGTVETVANTQSDATRPLQPGDPVVAGTALFTLATSDDYVVRTTIDEQDVAAVAVGQRARVSGEDLGGHVLSGRVASINAVAQKSNDPANASHQVVTTVRLAGAPAFVREGMTANIDIITNVRSHVLVVDPAAIHRDADGGTYAFAVRNGVAVKTPVTTGAMNQFQAIISGGLASGDTVVADQISAVADGVAIRPER
jgi:RND family efflux transporter MFP subunit